MKTVTFFNTEEELKQLTGLPLDRELWEVGFDLDSWNFGFVSDIPWELYNFENYYEHWLLHHMHNYNTAYKVNKYNGKYYYMHYYG